jgi:DNA-binding response OmpR family regulator
MDNIGLIENMSLQNCLTFKVLIVDDEDLTRVLLSQVLERLHLDNLEILLAEDGEEAIRLASDERPDLILLDVLLPKVNGYDVCRQVRNISDYNPYIIILTARGHSGDRERAETIGANDFMTKPFNPSLLVQQVLRFVDKV